MAIQFKFILLLISVSYIENGCSLTAFQLSWSDIEFDIEAMLSDSSNFEFKVNSEIICGVRAMLDFDSYCFRMEVCIVSSKMVLSSTESTSQGWSCKTATGAYSC